MGRFRNQVELVKTAPPNRSPTTEKFGPTIQNKLYISRSIASLARGQMSYRLKHNTPSYG